MPAFLGDHNSYGTPNRATLDANNLAKDFAGFRQVMLDRMAVLAPTWRETHESAIKKSSPIKETHLNRSGENCLTCSLQVSEHWLVALIHTPGT
jgi:hypothetical protein